MRGRYGHAQAIDLKRGIRHYKHLSRTQTRAQSVLEFETNFTKLFLCFGCKSKEIAPAIGYFESNG